MTDVRAALAAPLRLAPKLVAKPWGGRRLGDGAERVGERWEVADLAPAATDVADPWTPVAEGPLAGRRLRDLLAVEPEGLLGEAAPIDGGFPLLVKLLDAGEDLSVQVHPPEAYVARHPDAALKTESWVVVDAEAGAVLRIGLADGVDIDDVRRAAGTPAIVDLLAARPAIPGETHHLPAGVVHALGAGAVVAEVQTPSDTTYRLYDWSAEHGRAPRTLHLDEALACLALAWEHNTPAPPPAPPTVGALVETDRYELARRALLDGETLAGTRGRPEVLRVLRGALEAERLARPVAAGEAVLLPAACAAELRAVGPTEALVARP